MSCSSAAAWRMSRPLAGRAYASFSASKIDAARVATCSQCRSFEWHLRAKRRTTSMRSATGARGGDAVGYRSSIIDSSTPSRMPRSFTSTRWVPSRRINRAIAATPATMMSARGGLSPAIWRPAPRRENHLGAASPDADDGGQAVVQVVVAGHAPERQPGLLFGGHDLDTHPAAPPSLADEVPSVRSLAHRAGGDRAQLADAEALGDGLHPPQRLERLLHRAVADAPAGVEPAAQPRHLAVLVEHPVGSVRLHLGDDQPHRVGADVDRRETRRRRRDGPSGSGGRSAPCGRGGPPGPGALSPASGLWGGGAGSPPPRPPVSARSGAKTTESRQ